MYSMNFDTFEHSLDLSFPLLAVTMSRFGTFVYISTKESCDFYVQLGKTLQFCNFKQYFFQWTLVIADLTNNDKLKRVIPLLRDKYRSLAKHSRPISFNFSRFGPTISQGRLSLKDCNWFTGFNIDFDNKNP